MTTLKELNYFMRKANRERVNKGWAFVLKYSCLHQNHNQQQHLQLSKIQKSLLFFLCGSFGPHAYCLWVRCEAGVMVVGKQDVTFDLKKIKQNKKSEIRSPYTSLCFFSSLRRGSRFNMAAVISHTSREQSYTSWQLYFSRWVTTALRRLACSNVWLSSSSSLLGKKVVMRMNSLAAMAGLAATKNCRRSDTLRNIEGCRK